MNNSAKLLLAMGMLGGGALFWWFMQKREQKIMELMVQLKNVLPDRLGQWSAQIAAASLKTHPSAVDEFEWGKVIAAIMDRESGGQNIVGDYGHGKGLMQIDDRYHSFARSSDWINPDRNVMQGAAILRAFYEQANGDLARTIAAYNAGNKVFSSNDPDEFTTGGNYSSDILTRIASYGA